jgi:hypothetical protein
LLRLIRPQQLALLLSLLLPPLLLPPMLQPRGENHRQQDCQQQQQQQQQHQILCVSNFRYRFKSNYHPQNTAILAQASKQ